MSSLVPTPSFDQKTAVLTQFWPVDENYLGSLGIQLIAGRNFSSRIATDSMALIVNEAAVRLFGFKDPLNKSLYAIPGFYQTCLYRHPDRLPPCLVLHAKMVAGICLPYRPALVDIGDRRIDRAADRLIIGELPGHQSGGS